MTKKMTYAQAITAVLNGEAMTDEIRDRLTALKASVEKKNSSSTKTLTATQKANATTKEAILAHLSEEHNRMFTITEMIKEFSECAELTNQKMSALISQMVKEGAVERIEDKRKAYFRVILAD